MARAPSLTFFGGKGGVGKTTCSAAAAAWRAREGDGDVLVVSTDPAHSLGDVLAARLGPEPTRVAPSLWAAQLDADRALARWLRKREDAFRTIAERGTYLDEDDVDRLLSLSLPGVDELVGLVELARLANARDFVHVVVDTAPTGHTVRLLEMPETLGRLAQVFDDMHAKHRFMASSLGGTYRPDFADAVIADVERQAKDLVALVRERSSFTWVLLPEILSIEESKDGIAAIEALGIRVSTLVVNRTWPPPEVPCPSCAPRVAEEARAIDRIFETFPERRLLAVPAAIEAPRGPEALAALAATVTNLARGSGERRRSMAKAKPPVHREWLALPARAKLVLVGGKGGVGKTTVACATALDIAARRPKERVLLLSTDPAHSLGDALDRPVGDEGVRIGPNLRVRELDAKKAFDVERERYRASIDDLFASIFRGSMDASFDRQVLEDLLELAPPGIDEIFALVGIVDALVPDGRESALADVAVIDTAPTGHTLRLLALPDAALEWVHAIMAILLKYRHVVGLGELAADLTRTAGRLRELAALLHDPARCAFVAVTRAAELPVVETERMLARLGKLHVPVAAVVVNATTAPDAACRRCRASLAAEKAYLARLATKAKRPTWTVSAMYPPPRGLPALDAFRSRARGV